jgi:hypothetical protein
MMVRKRGGAKGRFIHCEDLLTFIQGHEKRQTDKILQMSYIYFKNSLMIEGL